MGTNGIFCSFDGFYCWDNIPTKRLNSTNYFHIQKNDKNLYWDKLDIEGVDWNEGEATPAGTARRLRLQAQAVPAESVRPEMEINSPFIRLDF